MSIDTISGGGAQYRGLQAHCQDARAARFEANDTDKSGGLSLDEFKSARSNSPKHAADIALDPANNVGRRGAADVFTKLDTDGNGEVTKAEFAAGKPKGGGNRFSSEMMTSLLSLQEISDPTASEASAQPSILDILDSASKTDDSTDVDLTGTLLDSLNSSDEEEK